MTIMHHAPAETRFLSRDQARALDHHAIHTYAIPSIILMENAAAAVEEALLTRLETDQLILIIAGPGNNGGDGLALARKLFNRNLPVGVILAFDPARATGDPATNLRIAERMNIPLHTLNTENPAHDLDRIAALWSPAPCRPATDPAEQRFIVDAILGTGLDRPLTPPLSTLADWINTQRARGSNVLSIDIPTGLDCDTGEPLGPSCIRADHTVTLAGLKKGFLNPAARAWTGTVSIGDIGAPTALLRAHGEHFPDQPR